MKKILLITAAFLALMACSKEATVDHNVGVEFPLLETLQTVSVSIGGSADIVLTPAAEPVRYQSLAIYYGPYTEDLLEDTFWKGSSLQWIFILQDPNPVSEFAECGFVDVLKARGLSDPDVIVYAASNVYDKISGMLTGPVRFNVKVREESL